MTLIQTLDIAAIALTLSIVMVLRFVMTKHARRCAGSMAPLQPKPLLATRRDEPRDPRSARSEHTAYCYVAGTMGLCQTKAMTGRSWWKVGCVGPGAGSVADRLANRMRDLDIEGYASVTQTPGGWVREDGFSNWRLQPINANPRPDCPAIQILPFAIAVTLPPTMSFGEFEARFRGALRRWSLARFLGKDAVYGRRFTPRGTGYAVATELFTIRPKRKADVDLIVAAIASVVEDRHASEGQADGLSAPREETRRDRLSSPVSNHARPSAIAHRCLRVNHRPLARHCDETVPVMPPPAFYKGQRCVDHDLSRAVHAADASSEHNDDPRPNRRLTPRAKRQPW